MTELFFYLWFKEAGIAFRSALAGVLAKATDFILCLVLLFSLFLLEYPKLYLLNLALSMPKVEPWSLYPVSDLRVSLVTAALAPPTEWLVALPVPQSYDGVSQPGMPPRSGPPCLALELASFHDNFFTHSSTKSSVSVRAGS